MTEAPGTLPVLDDAPAFRRALAPDRTPASGGSDGTDPGPPHVVAWNLTKRCNLECPHCYIAAGEWRATGEELGTPEALDVLDQVLDVNEGVLLILSGGEPLLRDDVEEIARRATDRGATVVVGTNGTLLDGERIESLKAAGVTGVAVSIDSLDPSYHDRFRHGDGALEETLAAVERLRERRLDFIVQTTLTRGNRDELAGLAAWSAERGAVSFNLYFLVATGRGEGMRGLPPEENEEVLAELAALEREYRGRMLVRSKCQPALMRHVHREDPDSPLLGYETRCPCGIHYCRITPEGKVTPCPYLPAVAGDLATHDFGTIWRSSPLFRTLREGELGGKCGRCEYRGICGGCRARAYADTGDPLAADASCAYEPDGETPVVDPPTDVTYGSEAEAELPWTEAAEARISRVPSFVRGVVTSRVERFARERDYDRVTPEVLDEVRRALPVDFSERRPFFLGGESDG